MACGLFGKAPNANGASAPHSRGQPGGKCRGGWTSSHDRQCLHPAFLFANQEGSRMNELFGKAIADQLQAQAWQLGRQINAFASLKKEPWIKKVVRRKGRPVRNWDYAVLPDGTWAHDGRIVGKTFVGPLTYERQGPTYCDCCGPTSIKVRYHKPRRTPLKDVVFERIEGGFRVSTVEASK